MEPVNKLDEPCVVGVEVGPAVGGDVVPRKNSVCTLIMGQLLRWNVQHGT